MLLKLSTLLIICGAAASALPQLEYGSSLLRRQAIVNCDDAPFNYPGDPIGSGVQDFDCAQQFVFNNLTFYENCRPQCDAFRALFTDGCQTTAPAFVGCFCSSSAVNIFSTCAQCVNSTAVIQIYQAACQAISGAQSSSNNYFIGSTAAGSKPTPTSDTTLTSSPSGTASGAAVTVTVSGKNAAGSLQVGSSVLAVVLGLLLIA